VYHLFYNAPSVAYIVLLQAFFTFLGNCTLAFASYRLAVSNGWTLRAALGGADDSGDVAPLPAATPSAATVQAVADAVPEAPTALLAVFAWTVVSSYVIKYGETLLPFTIDDAVAPYAAAVLIGAPTALNMWKWIQRSQPGAESFDGLI
jgi:hypothetical protein